MVAFVPIHRASTRLDRRLPDAASTDYTVQHQSATDLLMAAEPHEPSTIERASCASPTTPSLTEPATALHARTQPPAPLRARHICGRA